MDRLNDEEEARIEFVKKWYTNLVEKSPEDHLIILSNLCDELEASTNPEVYRTIIELPQSWHDLEIDAVLSTYYSSDGVSEADVSKLIMEKVRSKTRDQILELYAHASLEDKGLFAELE
jgi:hypothetical protein